MLGCERPPAQVVRSREIMGTFARVTGVAPDEAQAAAAVESAYTRLADVNRLMSDYVDESEVGQFNRLSAGQRLRVSPETFTCVVRGLEVATASGGAFDMTCRPLIALWKRCGRAGRLPTEAELAAAQALTGVDKIGIDPADRSIWPMTEGVQLDLGGIAKGYALDLAGEALRRAGATSGLIDVGGDVLAVGRRPDGKPWRVGIKHPFTEGIYTVLLLADKAVATSGVQQRFYDIEGKRYSHIIDPRTGWPAEQAPSVTVIAPDGITADAWGTVLSVLSVAEGKQRLTAPGAPPIEVMWITGDAADPVVDETPGFAAYLAY